jgi:ABC-type lipoprotein export system ATPase subunit
MTKLTVENVSYKYQNAPKPAVDNLNCTFEASRLYAIMGASGSGKSTFLSMLAGLDHPSGGEIRFGEDKLKDLDLDRYRRESISMIFQSFQLLPLLTVVENVCYPMELNGINPKDAKDRAKELLSSVGITADKIKRFPSKLSGGKQQRVAIARSLASGAKIILADEPTGNLDAENAENIIEILSKLAHERDYCVIVVTHDIEVSKTADVVYTMTDGKLLMP